MGGNAIKGSERYTKEEMEYVHWLVKADLTDAFDPVHILDAVIPHCYHDKEDHGDVDILVDSSKYSMLDLRNYLQGQNIAYVEVKNSNVISYGMWAYVNYIPGLPLNTKRLIQVDVIFVENLRTADFYFSYNDLGNLMGRLAHKMGFKLGHNGLSYVFREGSNKFAEEVVETDPIRILEFLGLDVKTYYKGFDTLENIFEFVASSEYFSADIYLLHNLNNASRTRDRKRPTYNAFLKWCEENGHLYDAYPWPVDGEEKEILKDLFLMKSFQHFNNGWEDRHFYTVSQHAFAKERAAWLDGNLVIGVTELEGKELGQFMATLKEVYNLDKCFQQGISAYSLVTNLWETW